MRRRLVAAALIAVLLGTIGCGRQEGSPQHAGDGGQSAAAPLSVVRHGNEFTLTGEVRNPAVKRALLDAVLPSIEAATVVDMLTVAPSGADLDFSVAAPVFDVASLIDDFSLAADGDTVRLGGTATKPAESAAVEGAAEQAWPRSHIVNEIVIGSPG